MTEMIMNETPITQVELEPRRQAVLRPARYTIQVTRDQIKRSRGTDPCNCICALSISEALGQGVIFCDGEGTLWPGMHPFRANRAGWWFEKRNMFTPKFMQWTGQFSIELL